MSEAIDCGVLQKDDHGLSAARCGGIASNHGLHGFLILLKYFSCKNALPMHHNQTYFRSLSVLAIFSAIGLFGCSSESSPTGEVVTGSAVKDSRLTGKWNMSSTATLGNGHDVTADNDYDFRSDGTFTNFSRSKLLNGDTGKPFYTSTTTESGTWTVDGDTTCWTTPKATLDEFETFTDLITREMIEEGLMGDAPPECFTIVSSDDATVILQPSTGGDTITLTRRK